MVELALKSVAVLALAWLSTVVLRRQSAAIRHLVWRTAFASLLALPLLVWTAPSIELPLRAAWQAPDITVTVSDNGASPVPRATPAAAAVPAAPSAGRVDWRAVTSGLWLAGALLVLVHLVVAWAVTWRIRRSAAPFSRTPGVDARPACILESRSIGMPLTAGVMRPSVVLPESARDWSDGHLRMVLVHELAHVRRGDVAWQVVARAALCVYWWNPLAWGAWKAFVREREQAADDAVLAAGAVPSDYASLLLDMARTLRAGNVWSAAALAMARPAQLEGRLMKILDATVDRRAPRRTMAWIAGACALMVSLPLASMRAQQMSPSDVDAFVRNAAEQKNHEALEQAARNAERTLNYDAAKKMLDASAAIRAQGSPADRQAGLLKVGEFEQRRNHYDRAEALYQQVLGVSTDSAAASTAMVNLGVLALIRQDLAAAEAQFNRALSLPDVPQGAASMWLGVLRERTGNRSEAEALYRRAAQDTTSPGVGVRRSMLAQFLRRDGRDGEAQALDVPLKRDAVAPPPGVYRMGGGVERPNLVERVEPQYSEEARAAKYQGTAVFTVVVGTDGRAHDIQPLREVGLGLDQKAIEALSQWRFEPGTKDGQPVPVQAQVEINWRLK